MMTKLQDLIERVAVLGLCAKTTDNLSLMALMMEQALLSLFPADNGQTLDLSESPGIQPTVCPNYSIYVNRRK